MAALIFFNRDSPVFGNIERVGRLFQILLHDELIMLVILDEQNAERPERRAFRRIGLRGLPRRLRKDTADCFEQVKAFDRLHHVRRDRLFNRRMRAFVAVALRQHQNRRAGNGRIIFDMLNHLGPADRRHLLVNQNQIKRRSGGHGAADRQDALLAVFDIRDERVPALQHPPQIAPIRLIIVHNQDAQPL